MNPPQRLCYKDKRTAEIRTRLAALETQHQVLLDLSLSVASAARQRLASATLAARQLLASVTLDAQQPSIFVALLLGSLRPCPTSRLLRLLPVCNTRDDTQTTTMVEIHLPPVPR